MEESLDTGSTSSVSEVSSGRFSQHSWSTLRRMVTFNVISIEQGKILEWSKLTTLVVLKDSKTGKKWQELLYNN